MADQRELLASCLFYFEADGITERYVKEVSGFGVENTPAQEVHGCGKGGRLHRQATPTVAKFPNITIKMIATVDIEVYKWYKKCNEDMGIPRQWMQNRKTASITAYNQQMTPLARWNIINCYPVKYTGPTLTASSGDMATETIELVHEGIERIQ
jgi:phage tail-like protein